MRWLDEPTIYEPHRNERWDFGFYYGYLWIHSLGEILWPFCSFSLVFFFNILAAIWRFNFAVLEYASESNSVDSKLAANIKESLIKVDKRISMHRLIYVHQSCDSKCDCSINQMERFFIRNPHVFQSELMVESVIYMIENKFNGWSKLQIDCHFPIIYRQENEYNYRNKNYICFCLSTEALNYNIV